MSIWYALCELLPLEMLRWDFMKNALLALLLIAPLFGILSTMIVTGRMSFFSDALGHSAFTGIAIGSIFGMTMPIWAAVDFSIAFALLFSWVRSRSATGPAAMDRVKKSMERTASSQNCWQMLFHACF